MRTNVYSQSLCFYLEGLSEDDLLSQYSLSFAKKTKEDGCEGRTSSDSSKMPLPALVDGTTIKNTLSTPPTTRNKFAAFLQRKNQESGAVVVPGTRSRYGSISRMLFVYGVLYCIDVCFNALRWTSSLVGEGGEPDLTMTVFMAWIQTWMHSFSLELLLLFVLEKFWFLRQSLLLCFYFLSFFTN